MLIRPLLSGCVALALFAFAPVGLRAAAPDSSYDVVIYGGTSAAITAAVQAKKMGKSVIVVSPDKHLGGLTSGGLGWTDSGNKAVIGGLARQFYHRVWKAYQQPEAWKWQEAEEYGNKGQGTPAIDQDERTMWIFEPHVAEQVFDAWVGELQIPVVRSARLDRKEGVDREGLRIVSITTLDGQTYRGRMFIDATYEGDLMAAAGVSYHVGREASSQYGEKWNGVQVGVLHHRHHFGAVPKPISPYVVPGDPSSGLLPRISPDPPGERGEADKRVQAYCFRMCLTDAAENRIPFPKPEGYDPNQYELLVRIFDAGWRETFDKFDPIPNHKTDTNNHGPFSTDNIGYNYDYPEGSYEARQAIIKEHETYQKGLMYFLANDPRVPEEVRTRMQTWGLPKDEFTDNGHWPHQIYVREARRMVGRYVMTENELLKQRPTPESIGMGSYTMDSHNVQRYVTPDGYVQNEGDIGVGTRGPYEIAYGSLVPKEEECENLLVPVCVSSSHIAFGSMRMEPVFMILGQSAATAAAMAIDDDTSVQAVPYDQLSERLVADGQVLQWSGGQSAGSGLAPAKMEGVVVDDEQAKLTGNWDSSTSQGKWVAAGYLHDGNTAKGDSSATFTVKLPAPGRYEVRMAYAASLNRASNVPVTIRHAEGMATVTVNQKETPPIDGLLVSLGTYPFSDAPAHVIVLNSGTDGHVIVDAVQWLPAAN